MPHVDELLDRLGETWYITILDLIKAYWQIPLIPDLQEKTHLCQSIQRLLVSNCALWIMWGTLRLQLLMDQVLQTNNSYDMAYLDDVVIYS